MLIVPPLPPTIESCVILFFMNILRIFISLAKAPPPPPRGSLGYTYVSQFIFHEQSEGTILRAPKDLKNEEDKILQRSQNSLFLEMSNFRVQAKKLHLTYKTHIDHEELLEWLTVTLGELKWYSIVWEEGHAEENATPYPHTHVCLETVKKMDFRDPRKLDFQEIHPNLVVLKTKEHVKNTWEYHEKAPVKLTRSKASPIISKEFYEDIIRAPTLVEAIKLSGVEVKSVQDVRAIRSDRGCAQEITPLSKEYLWTVEAPTSWNVLFVTGGTGFGKTRWALAQFASPLLVSHLEDLKAFRYGLHDGIVFDDISLTGLSPTSCIHLVDSELPRTIRVMYGSLTIQAGVKKIFTSNESLRDVMPVMTDVHFAAISRRLTVMEVKSPMFSRPATSGENQLSSQVVCSGNVEEAAVVPVPGYPPMADTFLMASGSGTTDMEPMDQTSTEMEN